MTAKLASVKSGASAKSKDTEHMRKRNRMKKRLANFIEDEAELGSDDEERADLVNKAIDRNDEDENEEGHDQELEDFIDRNYKADEDEINNPTDAAYQKFVEDCQNDERDRVKTVMQAVIDGHNKKRRQPGTVNEDVDEFEQRRLERVREREEMIADNKDFNEDEVAQHLLEGGANRARRAIALKQLAEEEELSEDELR